MTKKYLVNIVIDDDYDNIERHYFNDFDAFWSFILSHQSNLTLSKEKLNLNKAYSNPFAFMKVTQYKKGSETDVENVDYIVYIETTRI